MNNDAPQKIDKTCSCGAHYSEFPIKPRPQLDLEEKDILAWYFECPYCKSTLLVKSNNWNEIMAAELLMRAKLSQKAVEE